MVRVCRFAASVLGLPPFFPHRLLNTAWSPVGSLPENALLTKKASTTRRHSAASEVLIRPYSSRPRRWALSSWIKNEYVTRGAGMR